MVQIRYNIFETNSSSSDYYNDGPDDSAPDTYAYQTIHIIFKFEDEISEERQSQIIENIINEIIDGEYSIIDSVYLGFSDPEIDNIDGYDDEISFDVKVTASTHFEGSYYPATRYSPAEYPDIVLDDDREELPKKNIDFDGKADLKESILKALKEKGYKEIIGIVDIYGDEVDEQEYYDNIDYI